MKQIFVIILLIGSVLIAKSEHRYKLDLKEAIRLAIENNHDYKQAKLDFEKAEAQVKQAYGSALFPVIEGNINYNRAIKRQVITFETPFFSGTFPVGTDNTLSGSVNVTQPIFRGAMFLAIKIAETFADISAKNREQSKLELILQVKQAYYTHLIAKELVKLSDLQLKMAEENFKNTEAMYKAGLASDYDLTKAKVQYKNSIPAKTEALNQLKLSANNLKLILGIGLDSQIEITDTLHYVKTELPDFDEGLKQLFLNNKILKQVELQTKMQDYNVSYEFSKHLPEITAFGSWTAQAQENDPRIFSDWRYRNSASVGLSMRIPIFNGFTTHYQVEQAELDFKKAQEGLRKTQESLRNEYESVLMQIRKTMEQIEAYKSSIEEAEKGYSIAKKRFNAGLGTQIELTSSLMEFTNSKVNYLRVLQQYYLLHAQLDMLLGKSFEKMNNL